MKIDNDDVNMKEQNNNLVFEDDDNEKCLTNAIWFGK